MAGKRLITESDVRALARGAALVLDANVIATPAALDLAFERGLRIVRAEVGARSDAGGSSAVGSEPAACATCSTRATCSSRGPASWGAAERNGCCNSGGACGCGGGSAGGCTWKKMLATDTTYVVVVKDGRASISRLAASGPLPFA